jgi:hypothetical protein
MTAVDSQCATIFPEKINISNLYTYKYGIYSNAGIFLAFVPVGATGRGNNFAPPLFIASIFETQIWQIRMMAPSEYDFFDPAMPFYLETHAAGI